MQTTWTIPFAAGHSAFAHRPGVASGASLVDGQPRSTRDTVQRMITLAELVPEDTFIAPRLLEEMQPGSPFVGQQAEALSGALLAVCGSLPILAHEAASTAPLLDAIAASGLSPPTAVDRFDSRDGYVARVCERMAQGGRAWFTCPVPLGLFPDEPIVVPPSLIADLNLRSAIDRLVPPENRTKRRVIEGRADVAQALAALRPGLVVKDARLPSSSGGTGVWVLRRKRHVTRARTGLAGADRIVIEARVPYTANFCVQCTCAGKNEVAFLGSSMQRTRASGIYLGNRFDPAAQPSSETCALAMTIAAAAAQLGYRGIAGFDILEREDGPPVAIDLNFRPNASTPFLMAFGALGAARGFDMADLIFATSDTPSRVLLARLWPLIHEGWLVVLGLFDPQVASMPNGPTNMRLMVMGRDLNEIQRHRKTLRRAGLALADERLSPVQRIARRLRRFMP